MDEKTRTIGLKVIIDIFCLLLVGIPILIFYGAGSAYERGFFCDDSSLKYPFRPSTVPSWLLYVYGLGLPIISILAIEWLLYRNNEDKIILEIYKYKVPRWFKEVYKHVGVFGFGAVCSQLTTDLGKYTIGRLRPHFFELCRPNVNCDDPSQWNKYHRNFVCLNQAVDAKLIKDVRLSFPSGHSSFSFYCMVFLAFYLQAKVTWRGSKLAKHVVQFFALFLAAYTALSRVSDYKHHWSDVLFGTVLGILVAVLNVVFVSDLFPRKVLPAVIADEPESLEPIDKPDASSHTGSAI